MVSGCVGFVGVFALTFGLWRSLWAGFVRRVSSFFQVVAISIATCAASDSAIDKFSFSDPILGGHPKPAINRHLKTGN